MPEIIRHITKQRECKMNPGYSTQCRELWTAVLRLALFEERNNPDYLKSRDFKIVISLAGYDVEAVLDRLDDMQEMPHINASHSPHSEAERARLRRIRQQRSARSRYNHEQSPCPRLSSDLG
jgi:hypothetical protein